MTTDTLQRIGPLAEITAVGSGSIELWPAPTNLADLARETVDAYRPAAVKKGLRLRLATGVDESVVVISCDRDCARQVLANLVSNAVKYTHGGGEVEVSVTFHADRFGERRAMVSVADTGPGIAREQLATLFDECARFDRESARGARIGLAISRRIASAMGGTIVAQSELGRGSVFTLVLPVA